jgi:hypothetical protein
VGTCQNPVADAWPGFFVRIPEPRFRDPSRLRKSPKFGYLAILSAKHKGLKSSIEHLHVELA